MKEIEIHDSVYEITEAYREGALAARGGEVRFDWNPYPDGSEQNYQWQYGYDNESDGEHIRDGVDVITDTADQN